MNKPTFKELYYLCVQKLTNFPYIEEDFDALTNYELLCKVVEELNKMIDNMNTQNESILALYDAFNTLKTYVDTYFENLDVQEEINNKLDEMAESGELTNLIKKYVDPIYQAYEEEINEDISNFKNQTNNSVNLLRTEVESIASGTPTPVNSVSEMTDTTKVYLLLTDGYVYYYDGTQWVQGFVYQATGIADDSINYKMLDDELKEQIQCDIPEYTTIDGSYLSPSGAVVTDQWSTSYCYTSPIPISKKSRILFRGAGSTSTGSIFTCDSEGNNKKLLLRNTSETEHDIEFNTNLDENSYIIICSIKTKFKNLRIYEIPVKNSDIPAYLDIKTNTNDTIIILSDKSQEYINNKYISYTAGIAYDYNGVSCTDFIEIIPNQTIKLISSDYFTNENPDSRGLAFYDENRKYISGYQYTQIREDEILTPENARYIRLTRITNLLCYNTSLKDIIFENNVEDELKKYNYLDLYKSFLHVGVIGDSLASGESVYKENDTNHYVDIYEHSWGQYMSRMSGNTYYNFSAGGMTTRSWIYTSSKGYALASDGNHPCEGYIIGLGENDYRFVDIGTSNDIDTSDYNNNADTFYGNYAGIIQRMKELYPKAKFFLLTMPSKESNRAPYNTAIRYIANLFDNCYLIDLENDYIRYFEEGSFIFYNSRGSHYNAVAYNYIAQLMSRWISKIMKENISQFRQVEFINTNYEY